VTDLYLLAKRFTGTKEKGTHWVRRVGDIFGIKPLRLPDGRFGDGEILSFGDMKIEAIHAPGHLNDHYCFFEQSTQTLITTDIDFTSFGPWYGNPEGDIDRFKSSIRHVMAFPYERVCSSHKSPIAGDATAAFTAFLKAFDHQKEQVLRLCDTPIHLEDMVECSPFYRNRMPDKIVQKIFETCMIEKNLDLLEREGKVSFSNGKYTRADT
jgi:glyoxylase-like metal-dependent hydrolase (beta-lactamase superfamily II)